MATRSFLLDDRLTEARAILQQGELAFPEKASPRRQEFSRWLEERLLERLNSIGDFAKLEPILLGSWARHELTPKSDIDLLLAGPEELVKEFTAKALREGLKLRSRTPENPADWSVGVEPFDVLALHSALALTPEASAKLEPQRLLARKNRRAILSAIRREREERHKRQDSISSFLEPNLKFGAGGLRDIEQALAVRELFAEKFTRTNSYPFKVLQTIKEELLFLRAQLHLLGSSDIMSAHDQLELAKLLRMETPKQLMKFVQSELERASFYADWACANAVASLRPRERARQPLRGLNEVVAKLKEDPDLLLQFEVRLQIDQLVKSLSGEEIGKALHKAIYSDAPDSYFLALYRTRFLEALLPDLKKLKGLVQHDHYHRFTADAHLIQTLREVQRAKVGKRSLGVLSKYAQDLSPQEWYTLKLTALFHDLAKGRKGDHSSEGGKLVRKYFADWGYSETLTADVRWLVENHLLLSTAAFRQNPQSHTTWKRLFERGVQGRRLILLALFTAIDIRATNPEAWTSWKSQLLFDLVKSMSSPQAQSLQKHLKHASGPETQEWLLKLDPALLQSLSPRVLVDDLNRCAQATENLPPKVIRQGGRLWARFHARADETGLFLSYVERLFGLGLNIQMSSVNTLPTVGVYDWFCLRTEKSLRQVSGWLCLHQDRVVLAPQVQFQSISLMSQDQDEWIFSFRGRDQRGLLLSAARALVEENLSLRWARAHTWGQQIDDIFSVEPSLDVEKTLRALRSRFVT